MESLGIFKYHHMEYLRHLRLMIYKYEVRSKYLESSYLYKN